MGLGRRLSQYYYYSHLVGVVGVVLVKEQKDIEEIPRDDHERLNDSKDGGQQLPKDRQVGEGHDDEDNQNIHLSYVKLCGKMQSDVL